MRNKHVTAPEFVRDHNCLAAVATRPLPTFTNKHKDKQIIQATCRVEPINKLLRQLYSVPSETGAANSRGSLSRGAGRLSLQGRVEGETDREEKAPNRIRVKKGKQWMSSGTR